MFLVAIPIALVVVGFVVWHSLQRGRRFVRAATYLRELDGGATPPAANAAAAVLFTAASSPEVDRWASQQAEAKGGASDETIAEARLRGFTS
jgi:hypothetical protein